MQMISICVCFTYADVRHMDMLYIYFLLSFPGQIRKKEVPDLPIVTGRSPAPLHNMWCPSQLVMTLYVVLRPYPVTRRAAPEKGALLIQRAWYTSGKL